MMESIVVDVLTAVLFSMCSGYPQTANRANSVGVTFDAGFAKGLVNSSEITDASGLGASRLHPGYFYTHNDHGGYPRIYVINSTGHLIAKLHLEGVTNFDWEDLSVGPCGDGSNKSCIYLGDFGDGQGHKAKNDIYRIPEPTTLATQVIIVSPADKLKFSWNRHDCDTLMVDPDGNVYIISKEHNAHGYIAMLPKNAFGTDIRLDVTTTAKLDIDSKHPGPQGGDISRDGNEILVKTKDAVYYWTTNGSRDYLSVLQQTGVRLPYYHETQGEAICWGPNGRDYYTLSEGHGQPFIHYTRGSK